MAVNVILASAGLMINRLSVRFSGAFGNFHSTILNYTNKSGGESKDSKADNKSSTSKQKPSPSNASTIDPTKYNTPEYFSHNIMSFYDIEVDFQTDRLPQPNSNEPTK